MNRPAIGRCPDENALTRALTGDSNDALRAHLSRCPRCAAEWSANLALIELARSTEPPMPSRDRSEQLRTEILAKSELARGPAQHGRRPRSRRWMVAGIAAVAVGVGLIVAMQAWSPRSATSDRVSVEIHRGSVTPHPGATFQLAGAQPDEIVRLTDGTISVAVAPLSAEERFRVVIGDGEVEVRGTAFEVTARADRLIAVQVDHGRVEVRPQAGPLVVLDAGDRWDAPEVASHAIEAPPLAVVPIPEAPLTSSSRPRAGPPHVRPAPSMAPSPAIGGRDPAEQAFADGWDALRTGDAAAAASLFEQCLSADPRGALAEDAAFWQGVALSRAGRRAGATRAFTRYLATFPASARAGEASTLLGWLLLDDGDLEGAEARFNTAMNDLSSSVRANAAEGLAEIARRRRL